jgi:hypothetical protein
LVDGAIGEPPLSGFDVRGRTPRRRWSLNAAERTRTGIERLDFDENPNQTDAIVLRDLRTSLPTIDYSTVTVILRSEVGHTARST